MKNTLRIAIIVLLGLFWIMIISGLSYGAGTCDSSGVTGTTPYTAASLSRADVQGCLTGAERGATVILPAGEATWTSSVTYSKALIIKGAGAGVTIIKNGQSGCSVTNCKDGGCNQFLLSYSASSESAATSDLPYRNEVSGITFDMQYQALGIRFQNRYASFPLTQIVVEGNSFVNCWDCGSTDLDPQSYALAFIGFFEGVVANNEFRGWPYIMNSSYNQDGSSVANFTDTDYNLQHGTSHFMYYEDNLFQSEGAITYLGREPFIITGDTGSKIVIRYNNFHSTRSWSSFSKPWSPHHPVKSGNVGGKGGEFYGNNLTQTGTSSWTWGTPRSGKNLLYFNRIQSPSIGLEWWMYNPTYYPGATTNTACGSDVYSAWVGQNKCDPTGQPQHLYQSYQWANIGGSLGDATQTVPSDYTGGRLIENTHYFNYKTSFTGASGVGCGTLANRPATCTTGVGYWATDQNCGAIANYVGVNPTTSISGTLYRCYPTNTWTAYYTPYTYPHPLRGDAPEDTTAPNLTTPCAGIASCVKPIIDIACLDESEPYTQAVYFGITSTDSTDTVKYCINGVDECSSETNYDTMANTFTGNTSNYWWTDPVVEFACGATHTVYVHGKDTNDNKTTASVPIVFAIASKGDSTAPVVASTTASHQSCTAASLLMTITTNEAATCKWSGADEAYADMDYYFSVTGGETVHHSVNITGQACESTVTRYVRCSDTQGNANASSTSIPITTDAAKSVTISIGGAQSITIGTGSNTISIVP